MFCTYLTIYYGDKMPKRYIGSSSLSRIEEGYRGSVSSREYKEIWESELRENPNLFKTRILSIHKTRKESLEKELEIQKKYDVKRNNNYINRSYAQPNGFFGRDVSGKNNPMYGSNRTGEKHKGGENISKGLYEFYSKEESKEVREILSKKWSENNPAADSETMVKIKKIWKETERNVGKKNGMYGKTGKLTGKKLYNNGIQTLAFKEGEQPEGWVKGRHQQVWNKGLKLNK